jgi:hypothetical protein
MLKHHKKGFRLKMSKLWFTQENEKPNGAFQFKEGSNKLNQKLLKRTTTGRTKTVF